MRQRLRERDGEEEKEEEEEEGTRMYQQNIASYNTNQLQNLRDDFQLINAK